MTQLRTAPDVKLTRSGAGTCARTGLARPSRAAGGYSAGQVGGDFGEHVQGVRRAPGRGPRLVEAYSLRWDYYRDGTRTVTRFECVAEPLSQRSVRHNKGLTAFLGAVLRPQGVEHAVPVRAAVGVRAEVVTQALDEGGGQAFGAQRVVVGQGGREAGHGDAEADRGGDHVAPGVLGGGDLLAELLVGQQRGQLGLAS